MFPLIQITLPSYSVMAFLGGICALLFIFFRLDKYKITFTAFVVMAVLSGVCALIGSKILFTLTQMRELLRDFSLSHFILHILQSGLVFYGGLFGVIFALCVYTQNDRDKRARIFQAAVPAFPLFHGFGRIGCFLAGCCYGKEISEPIQLVGIELHRIPVQLVESAAEFILFFALVLVERKKENCDMLRLYLILYAIIRFFDEFLRGDEIRGIYLGLSTSQWISIIILLYYLIKAFWRKSKMACSESQTGRMERCAEYEI